MKQKTLREDAHSREAETCRKRPRSARECAKAHSFLHVVVKGGSGLAGSSLCTGKIKRTEKSKI